MRRVRPAAIISQQPRVTKRTKTALIRATGLDWKRRGEGRHRTPSFWPGPHFHNDIRMAPSWKLH